MGGLALLLATIHRQLNAEGMGSIEPYETSAGRRYRVRYRKPDRSQTQKRGFRTKRDAERYLATQEVAQMRGEWVDPSRSRVDVAVVAADWIAAQVHVKASTRSGYEYSLAKHILPRWGTTRVGDVSHGEVQRWATDLSKKLGPSTLRQVVLVLSGIFKLAIRDGRLQTNPVADLRLPRITRDRRGYLTHVQVVELAAQCGDYADLILTLAYTGLRWGELAALRAKSVDLQRERILVDEAVADVRGKLIWGTPKTHERRSVPMPEFLVDRLAHRVEGKQHDDLIFTSALGVALRNGNFRRRVFQPAVVECRATDPTFPVITPHDLRHTAASLAVSAGAHVKAVQRMLGHASAAMTLDVYADLFDDDLNSVAAALDAQASRVVAKMWPEATQDRARIEEQRPSPQ
jgi:integrase